MKKKILLLAFCLVMPFSLLLTACSVTPPEEVHTHSWGTVWLSDATHHWHSCEGCNELNDKEKHDLQNATQGSNETHHWMICNDCESKVNKVVHDFSEKIIESKYLSAEATTTSGALYLYSCTCGMEGTETFEVSKPKATISNLALDFDKTYDRQPVINQSDIDSLPYAFETDTDGELVAVEFKLSSADDSTYTTEIPYNAGVYKVRITLAETIQFAETSFEEEFTILPKTISSVSVSKEYDGTNTITSEIDDFGIISGDEVIMTATMSDSLAYSSVIIDYAFSGKDVSNYNFKDASVVGSIMPKVISSVSLAMEYNSKNYFETTLTSENCTGVVEGDSLAVTFNTESVNAGDTVVSSNSLTISGGKQFCYDISYQAFKISILPKKINMVIDAEYNGTLQYLEMVSANNGSVENSTLVIIVEPTSKNVGTYKTSDSAFTSVKFANISFVENTNYQAGDITLNITPKTISSVNITATQEADGIYDIKLTSGICVGDELILKIDATVANDKLNERLYVFNSPHNYYPHLRTVNGADLNNYKFLELSGGMFSLFLTILPAQ